MIVVIHLSRNQVLERSVSLNSVKVKNNLTMYKCLYSSKTNSKGKIVKINVKKKVLAEAIYYKRNWLSITTNLA